MNNTTTTTTTKAPAVSAEITESILRITSPEGRLIHVNAAELSDEIRHAAMMHGLKQKIVDAAAISRNPETGRSATITDKFDAMSEVATRLYAGEWNKRREGGEGGGTGGLLFAALVRLYAGRKTDEEIRAFLAGKTDKEQAALRASSRVAPIIQTIKDERAAKKGLPDGDDLLAGLDDSPV